MFSIGTGSFFVRGALVSNLSTTTRIRFPDSFSTASRRRTTTSRPQPIPRFVSVQEDREWRVPHATSASTIARASSDGSGDAAPASATREAARRARILKPLRHLFRILGSRCYDTRPLFWPHSRSSFCPRIRELREPASRRRIRFLRRKSRTFERWVFRTGPGRSASSRPPPRPGRSGGGGLDDAVSYTHL